MELGQVRELEGKYNLAFESLSEAVLQAPYYAEPHWQLGELFVKLGRRSDAIREFSLAVKSNPELVMPPDVFFRTAAVGEAAPLN
jgi:tetratricopeptide (TPR) repeat protein